jgi:hypothetical protein
VPAQTPVQPPNVELGPAVAVTVTTAFGVNPRAHVPLVVPPLSVHSIPGGLLETDPAPLPFNPTVSVSGPANDAVTVRAWSIVTVHGPVPEHPPPDQPVNALFVAAVAVSVTTVP